MRRPAPASAAAYLLLTLMAASGSLFAGAPPASSAHGPAGAVPSAGSASPDVAATEAAARHAKRTSCLRQAKFKKLLAADKDVFVRECLGSA